MTAEKLAQILMKDLDYASLARYLLENKRAAQSEITYGRSPKRFNLYVRAAEIALAKKGK